MTQRWRLTLEYDGGPFVGWQRQTTGLAVQEVLEIAIDRFCGERVTVRAAGRTDSGVHARGQVVHVDLEKPTEAERVMGALNFHLRPHPVAVLAAAPVADDFDARFSAIQRRYRYRVLNRRAPPVLDRGRVWWVSRPLDRAAMRRAAADLLGTHDFTSLRAAECQAASPVKTIDAIALVDAMDGEALDLHIAARSFLHHQVRNIIGTLVEIGQGRRPADAIPDILAARNRAAAGQTAPPDGLVFEEVRYPPQEPVMGFDGGEP